MVDCVPHIYRVETANNGSVTLNASSFIKVLNANPNRHYLRLSNIAGVADIIVNLCEISGGMDDCGIYIKNKESWEMPTSAIYTGEICAKAKTDAPKLIFVEY